MTKVKIKRTLPTPTKKSKKTVIVERPSKRPAPKGEQNDRKRLSERLKYRRPDGTLLPQSSYSGARKSAEHMQNFDLKQAFLETFRLMGGAEELANWATWSNSNQTEFYKLLSKLLPRDLTVGGGGIEPNNLSNLEDKELDAILEQHLARA